MSRAFVADCCRNAADAKSGRKKEPTRRAAVPAWLCRDSELQLLDFHAALDAGFDSHALLVFNRSSPFVDMFSTAH